MIPAYFSSVGTSSLEGAEIKMRLSPILAALVVLALMVMPSTADEVDDLILELKYGTPEIRRRLRRLSV